MANLAILKQVLKGTFLSIFMLKKKFLFSQREWTFKIPDSSQQVLMIPKWLPVDYNLIIILLKAIFDTC